MAKLPRSLSLEVLSIRRVPSFQHLQEAIELVVSPFSPVSPLQLPIPNFVHEEYQEFNKEYVSLLIGTFLVVSYLSMMVAVQNMIYCNRFSERNSGADQDHNQEHQSYDHCKAWCLGQVGAFGFGDHILA